MRLFFLFLVLVAACSRGKPNEGAGAREAPMLRLALVTDLKGYLEPCGCTSRPLGGIDRLAAQIRVLRDDPVPLLMLIAGDSFFDTDNLEATRIDQAGRNAKTLSGILNDLKVAATAPGRRDRAQPDNVVAELRANSAFPWLAMKSDVEVLRIESGGLRVAIVGVRPGTARDVAMAAIGTAQANTDLTIAMVYGSRRDANRIASIDGVDFVVLGGLDEDVPLAPHRAGDAWVLHAGRQGQGLTVVDIYRRNDGAFEDQSAWSRRERVSQLDEQIEDLSAKIAQWKSSNDANATDIQAQSDRLAKLEADRNAYAAPPAPAKGNAFLAEWIELPKEAPTDEAVTKLMRAHDKAVNQANREAFADLKPPPVGPNDVAYVGSERCGTCHQPAHDWWRTHPHGYAYSTLQKSDKEFNLDCVGCHVTGYGRPGGSTVTHNLDGALVNVGCEACHGPGGAHVANPEIGMVLDPPESVCTACHNEEHSDQFNYDAYKKTLMVPGHGLPVVPR